METKVPLGFLTPVGTIAVSTYGSEPPSVTQHRSHTSNGEVNISTFSPNPYSVTPDPPGFHREHPQPQRSLAHDYLEYRRLVETTRLEPDTFVVVAFVLGMLYVGAAGVLFLTNPSPMPFTVATVLWLLTVLVMHLHNAKAPAEAAAIRNSFPSVLHWVLDQDRRTLGEDKLRQLRDIPSDFATVPQESDDVTIEQYREVRRSLEVSPGVVVQHRVSESSE